MNDETISVGMFAALIAAAAGSLLWIVLATWLFGRRNEVRKAWVLGVCTSVCALMALGLGLRALLFSPAPIELGAEWFGSGHYRFSFDLVGDTLSLVLSALFSLLVGTIAAFSSRYLHKESGYFRFFCLLAVFFVGCQLVVLAKSLDVIFIGWELVGIASGFLIAFFHERRGPVSNALRAFVTYRICDVGLLGGAVWLHHSVGSAHLIASADHAWLTLPVPQQAADVGVVALFLLWATMGKSAQVPWTGWLPRAMEGPTPSSAIFYGAISVHLGPVLLLRAAPIFERVPWALFLMGAVGAVTALHATLSGRAQTDIKSSLAYASAAQVGLMYVEISLGWHVLALVHLVGHACVRCLQILASPNLLHEHHQLENAIGSSLPRTGGHYEKLLPLSWQKWLYRFALERAYLDALLYDYALAPLKELALWFERMDSAWLAVFATKESASVHPEMDGRVPTGPSLQSASSGRAPVAMVDREEARP